MSDRRRRDARAGTGGRTRKHCTMTEPEKPTSLKDFDARLQAAQARREEQEGERREAFGGGLGLALRIAVELVAALAVGVGIGWFLDSWLGTRPWLLIVFFILGAAAGMMNVFRAVGGFGYSAGYRKAEDNDGSTKKGRGE